MRHVPQQKVAAVQLYAGSLDQGAVVTRGAGVGGWCGGVQCDPSRAKPTPFPIPTAGMRQRSHRGSLGQGTATAQAPKPK